MSITFASEVSADIDWSNPDTDGLLTCQFDDGTTVKNLLTGATGETFDIANIVGVADGLIRVSATWVVKPANIDLDPFSLLQTQTDKQNEYGLKLTTASEQLVINFTGAYSGTITFTDDSTQPISDTGTFTLDGTTELFIREIEATDTIDSYYWDFNQTTGTEVIDKINGAVATLVNFPTDSGYVWEDGEIVGYQSTSKITMATSAIGVGANDDFNFNFTIRVEAGNTATFCGDSASFNSRLRVLSEANHFNIRWLDGIESNIAISEFTYGDLLNVELGRVGGRIDLRINGAWQGYLQNNTKSFNITSLLSSNIYGSNIFCQKFIININDILVHNYDFTTGDSYQIIDTESGNHAFIENRATSGFLPIAEKQVYTVGSTGDYPSLADHRIAQKGNGERLDEAIILEDQILSAEVRYYSGEFHNLTLKAVEGSEFNGVLGHADNIKVKSDGVMATTIFQVADELTIKGLDIESSPTAMAFAHDTNSTLNITDSGVYSENDFGLYNTANVTVKNSVITSGATQAVYDGSVASNITLLDSIIIGNSAYYGAVRNRYSSTVIQNCIVDNTYSDTVIAVRDDVGTATLSNNILSNEVDFTGAFVDEASGDYRINQAWADVNLLGNGWNNSDIASWAYYVVDETGSEQVIIVNAAEQLTQSQLSDITGLNNLNLIVAEQITQQEVANIAATNQALIINSEQKTETYLSAVASVNNLTTIISEQLTHGSVIEADATQLITVVQLQQLTEALIVNVTSAGAQDINVVVTEQKTESQALTVAEQSQLQSVISEQITEAINNELTQSALTEVLVCEQITNAVIVNVDEMSGIIISVVQTEQLTQAVQANVDVASIANVIISEQLAQYSTQQIDINLAISTVVTEQLTQAELIEVVMSNIAQQLNIDIDQISIEMLTPTYSIESLTPIYTIEHIH